MSAIGKSFQWSALLRNVFGAALCLVAVVNVRAGSAWFLSLGVAVIGVVIILGRRRIFRPGVRRTAGVITCRYIPWSEGNAYVLNVALPLLAVAMIAAGCAPGYPTWLRFGGILLLALTPLATWAAVRMWRRCSLCVSPSTLTVQLAATKGASDEIPREAVRSITGKTIPNGVSGGSLQVEIVYETTTLVTKTILLGLQLTVEPANLCRALVAWNDAAADDPDELMARIERILRGHSTADV